MKKIEPAVTWNSQIERGDNSPIKSFFFEKLFFFDFVLSIKTEFYDTDTSCKNVRFVIKALKEENKLALASEPRVENGDVSKLKPFA